MVKGQINPLSKEEMDSIMLEVQKSNEFDYMIFETLRTTGRRIGELYGIEEVKIIGRKVVGERTIYIGGKPTKIDKTIPRYKKTGAWIYGVQVKDIDFSKATMKVWVLKRRNFIQDETIIMPDTLRLIRNYVVTNKLLLGDYVFRKKNRSLRQIQKVFKQYSKKAGLEKNVTLHNLRHYFITELKRKGWQNDEIRKLTGHKSAAVLSIYDHIVANDIRDKATNDIKNI